MIDQYAFLVRLPLMSRNAPKKNHSIQTVSRGQVYTMKKVEAE
jgi:hypothetical protein